MNTPGVLGLQVAYTDHYSPGLLQPIARAEQREQLGLLAGATLPFIGADLWTGYELSWLNAKGKPELALLQLNVPCETPNLVESKSFKLYLNSLNQTRFPSIQAVCDCISTDLGKALWGREGQRASVQLLSSDSFDMQHIQELSGLSLDRLDLECDTYTPQPDFLQANFEEAPVSEVLCSRLLKSNCLVTGQPDWASVQISYSGPQIDQAGLLRYIVSFRQHQEFHEHCVERIFMDITQRCRPHKLCVYARYTRRGGLDINPLRSSYPIQMPALVRTARQ